MAGSRKAALGFIFLTLVIDVTGMGIIIPVIPSLIKELLHGSLSEAAIYGGLLTFSFATMQFLFSPLLGNLSDRFGRRPVLLCALFGFSLDYLILAFAPTIAWLFVGRLLAGIMGASFSTATAYIADITPPEKRAQNFGMIGVAFGVGFIIGPLMGGVLGQFGSRIPFFAAAGLAMLNWLYGFFILPESLAPENRRPFSWKRANPWGSCDNWTCGFVFMHQYCIPCSSKYMDLFYYGKIPLDTGDGRLFFGFCRIDSCYCARWFDSCYKP
jgi:DHA1 family tetracycline resistance protein-like MFS transporter